MLNLPIAMHTLRFSRAFLILFLSLFSLAFQSPAGPVITAPLPGAALQGLISITGTTALEGFSSSEVSYGYESDQTGTWFLLQQSRAPVTDGVLATWDTTTISDGNYRLRLQVILTDGRVQEVILRGLRVRNYSIIETSTPTGVVETQVTLAVEPTATRTPAPTISRATPTPLPVNPAEVTPASLVYSLLRGANLALIIFAALGLYLLLRRWIRRR